MKPKVSVIVPVYNIEAYIGECLNSIVTQTFKNIEIILIDDGSTDLSSKIIKDFAQKDNRIIIHSQSNQGVSAARNAGISLASGEYILFVDGDDLIVENAIEMIYKYAIATKVEIVIGNALFCYEDGRQVAVFPRTQELNMYKASGDICIMKLMEINAYPPLVYLFFIKRKFILRNKLYFKQNIIHEDELWCIQALFYAKHVFLIDFYYYMYRQREGSIMNSNNNLFRIKSLLIVVSELNTFAREIQKKNVAKESIGYIYFRIFVIYHVISKLKIEKQKKYILSKMKFFSELLIEIFPTLLYYQQKNCLVIYRVATLFINEATQ